MWEEFSKYNNRWHLLAEAWFVTKKNVKALDIHQQNVVGSSDGIWSWPGWGQPALSVEELAESVWGFTGLSCGRSALAMDKPQVVNVTVFPWDSTYQVDSLLATGVALQTQTGFLDALISWKGKKLALDVWSKFTENQWTLIVGVNMQE